MKSGMIYLLDLNIPKFWEAKTSAFMCSQKPLKKTDKNLFVVVDKHCACKNNYTLYIYHFSLQSF